MKDIKLILTDLDGTLFSDDKTVSSYTEGVIAKVREKGILFGIATGRSLYAVGNLINDKSIRKQLDVMIGFNGAQIVEDSLGVNEVNNPLDGKYMKEIIEHFEDLPCGFCIYVENTLYTYKDNKHSRVLAESNKFNYKVIEDADEFFKLGYPKLVLICDESDMPKIKERSKTFSNPAYHCMQTTPTLFEYMNINVSKSQGILRVCERHGFTIEQVCVFGDAANDRDMLECAGLGVCMINGDDETKMISDVVTKYDNNHNGVARFIEENFL